MHPQQPNKPNPKIHLTHYTVWVEAEGIQCDVCHDVIFLQQLNIMTYCSIMGHIMHTSFVVARLCQACGHAIDEDDPPF
jgi:hypothetical protein